MRKFFCATGIVLLWSLSAMAQNVPRVELSGGYSYAGSGSHGWDASVAGNVNKWLGLVADVSGQYTGISGGGAEEQIRTHSFLFGPRFSVRRGRRVTPFAHALVGASHIRSKATESGQTFIFTDTSFGVALGGGLDVRVNDHFAIRAVQADYLRTQFFNATQNKGRIIVGAVFRFGNR